MKLMLLFLLFAELIFPQKPVFSSEGVVSAATLSGSPVHAIVPNSIISIFGSNLANQTLSASTLPLPRTLAGTSVTIDGFPAPLFFVSPNQINAQVPQLAASGGFAPIAPIIVTVNGSSSNPVDVPFALQAPGIFTINATGCGDPVLLSSPLYMSFLPRIDVLALLGTGFGVESGSTPPDGQPSPSKPLALTPPIKSVTIGNRDIDNWFVAKAPGLVGVDQLNIPIPPDSPDGCSVPLQITGFSGNKTQPVKLRIRHGGGHCVDPPPESVGVLRWVKTISSGIDPPPPTDQLKVEFSSAMAKQLPQEGIADLARHACLCKVPDRPGPSCPGFESYQDTPLDPGSLTIQGPDGSPVQIQPLLSPGNTFSVANLPAGTIHEGDFLVSGSGGSGVGPIAAKLHIPPPIQLANDFPPGTVIDLSHLGFEVGWTGGDPNGVVRLSLMNQFGTICECADYTSKGTLGIGPRTPNFRGFAGEDVEMVVSVSSEGPQNARFSAQGLTLGGVHGWTYQWRFGGLTFK